ncbi:DUF2513 domain-containing protein [Helcococcus kunzii]|uniref:DUF2513 domain-containing protein n=1 Tax=Helcococcus kunzii ATCC 51366 TaxID=883114 RepID=H3NPF8_9FIRM|nr:DUF2513 domain-containing protein [Helcococcus kunzii]EHR33471.1 hypothetical protein HMPREF9709_01219 [Helcococcus kunzii ATCC 51366]
MKLNFDRVRFLLLDIEENIPLNHFKEFNSQESEDDVYTLKKLIEAGFINATVSNFMDGNTTIYVKELTYNGHEFLNNIRNPKAVEHTKNVLKEIGSASLQIMSQVASEFMMKQLGL